MTVWVYLLPEGLADAGPQWPCWLIDEQGALRPSTLQAVALAHPGAGLNLLLPAEGFSCVLSDPWPGRSRPSLRALSYAVEEQLAAELDQLQLFAGPCDAQRRCRVWVTQREQYTRWLALLQGLGVQWEGIYIDLDRLPASTVCGLWWADRWLIGGESIAPMAMSAGMLAALAGQLPPGCRWLNRPDEPASEAAKVLLAGHPGALNLLPRRAAGRVFKWPVKALAMTLALTWLGTLGLDLLASQRYEREAGRLYARSVERFQALYPDQQRIVDLAAQLRAVQQGPGAVTALPIRQLAVLAEQLQGQAGLTLLHAELQQGLGWQLQVNAASLAGLEQVSAQALAAGLAVAVGATRQQQGQVSAVLTLKVTT